MKKKILIVDDNLHYRFALRTLLGTELYEFDEASNVKEAEDLCRKHQYSLIFMDCDLGNNEFGHQAVDWIRHNGESQNQGTYIIVVTAHEWTEIKKAFEQAGGVQGRMEKPVTAEVLELAILKWNLTFTRESKGSDLVDESVLTPPGSPDAISLAALQVTEEEAGKGLELTSFPRSPSSR